MKKTLTKFDEYKRLIQIYLNDGKVEKVIIEGKEIVEDNYYQWGGDKCNLRIYEKYGTGIKWWQFWKKYIPVEIKLC